MSRSFSVGDSRYRDPVSCVRKPQTGASGVSSRASSSSAATASAAWKRLPAGFLPPGRGPRSPRPIQPMTGRAGLPDRCRQRAPAVSRVGGGDQRSGFTQPGESHAETWLSPCNPVRAVISLTEGTGCRRRPISTERTLVGTRWVPDGDIVLLARASSACDQGGRAAYHLHQSDTKSDDFLSTVGRRPQSRTAARPAPPWAGRPDPKKNRKLTVRLPPPKADGTLTARGRLKTVPSDLDANPAAAIELCRAAHARLVARWKASPTEVR